MENKTPVFIVNQQQDIQQALNEKLDELRPWKKEDQLDFAKEIGDIKPIQLHNEKGLLEKYILQQGNDLELIDNVLLPTEQQNKLTLKQIPFNSTVEFKLRIFSIEGAWLNKEERNHSFKLKLFNPSDKFNQGIHFLLQSMNVNEICYGKVHPCFIRHMNDTSETVTQNDSQIYKLELVSLELPTVPTEDHLINFNYLINIILQKKTKAQQFFINKEYAIASKWYENAFNTLNNPHKAYLDEIRSCEQKQNKSKELKIILLGNIIVSQYKINCIEKCIKKCEELIGLDPNNLKAHYYNYRCLFDDKKFLDAEVQLKKCIEIDPNDNLFKTKLRELKQQLQNLKKTNKINKGFFNNNQWKDEEEKEEKIKKVIEFQYQEQDKQIKEDQKKMKEINNQLKIQEYEKLYQMSSAERKRKNSQQNTQQNKEEEEKVEEKKENQDEDSKNKQMNE